MAPEATKLSDEQLIADAQQGDTAAFGLLVERYQDLVYNLVCRTLGRQERAEDVTQEVFIRAWRALAGFQGQSKFSSWLYRIALNCSYSELRRKGLPAESLASLDLETAYLPASGVPPLENRIADHDLVERLLEQLPPVYRSLVVLFYLQGQDCQEIARIVGRPVGTVKAYLHRARARLRIIADQLLESKTPIRN